MVKTKCIMRACVELCIRMEYNQSQPTQKKNMRNNHNVWFCRYMAAAGVRGKAIYMPIIAHIRYTIYKTTYTIPT